MRTPFLAIFLLLTACKRDDQIAAQNVVMPPLEVASETPGDWSALNTLVGRVPAESGLLENSPVSVDLNASLGPDLPAYRAAMMRAGPLQRSGDMLVTRAPDAWLVLQPADHAFRAGLRRGGSWQEWQTPASEVPRPGM